MSGPSNFSASSTDTSHLRRADYGLDAYDVDSGLTTSKAPSEWDSLQSRDEAYYAKIHKDYTQQRDPLRHFGFSVVGHLEATSDGQTKHRFGMDPRDKAYYAVEHMIKDGCFGDSQGFDLKNPEIRSSLALAQRIFGSVEPLGDLDFEQRLHAAKIYDALEREFDSWGMEFELPVRQENAARIGTTLKRLDFKRAFKPLLKFIGVKSLGNLMRVVKRKDPMNLDDFTRIFGDSYKPEDIPRILNSGIKLCTRVQAKLLTELSTSLAKRQKVLEASSGNDLARVLEANEQAQGPLKEEDVQKVVEAYKQKQPADSEMGAEGKELDKLKQTSKGFTQKQRKAILDGAKELGKAVHTWVQWGKDIKQREHRLEKRELVMLDFLDSIGITDPLKEFRNKPLESVQGTLGLKVLEAQIRGQKVSRELTAVYQKDVQSTKTAIEKCYALNNGLVPHGQALKDLSKQIIKHEKSVERQFAKADKALRMVYAGVSVIAVAATVATGFSVAAALPAIAKVAGTAQGGLGAAHKYTSKAWDQQHSWFNTQMEGISRAAKGIASTQGRLQGWLHTLMARQEQQANFLLMNPDCFAPQAYLRNLREKIAEIRKGMEQLGQQITDARREVAGHDDHLNMLKPALAKREDDLFFTRRKDKKAKNRRLARLRKLKEKMAHIASSRANTAVDIEQWELRQQHEQQQLATFQARLDECEEKANLPDHRKEGADKMSLKERLRSTEGYQQDLRKKRAELLAEMEELKQGGGDDEDDDSKQIRLDKIESLGLSVENIDDDLRDELLFELTTERMLGLQHLRTESESVEELLPNTLLNSSLRIRTLEERLPGENRKLQSCREREEEALKAYEAQQKLVDQLSDENKDPKRDPLHPEVRKLQESKDHWDDMKQERRDQEQGIRDTQTMVRDEKGLRDGHLWETLKQLPPDERMACSTKYLQRLRDSVEQRHEQLKDVKGCEPELRKDRAELRIAQQRHAEISYSASVDRWNSTPLRKREGMLPTIQREAVERYGLLAKAEASAKGDLPSLQNDEQVAKERRNQAESQLKALQANDQSSDADLTKAQQDFDKADKDYREARNFRKGTERSIKETGEQIRCNEEGRKSFYLSAHAARIRRVISFWQGESQDPYDRALGEQLASGIIDFDRTNFIREFSRVANQLEWFAESMHSEPLSQEDREWYRRFALGAEALASVATLGAMVYMTNETANEQWAKKFEALDKENSEVSAMDWLNWGKMIGQAVMAVKTRDAIAIAGVAIQAVGTIGSFVQVFTKGKKLAQKNQLELTREIIETLEAELKRSLSTLEQRLDGSMKSEVRKLRKEFTAQSRKMHASIAVLKQRVEKQSSSSQEDSISKELRGLRRACSLATAWAQKPEAANDAWVPRFLQVLRNQIRSLQDPDLTGSNKAKSTAWREMAKKPLSYIGLMGSKDSATAPALELLNGVGEQLLTVLKAAKTLKDKSFLRKHGKDFHQLWLELKKQTRRVQALETGLVGRFKASHKALRELQKELFDAPLERCIKKEESVRESLCRRALEKASVTLRQLKEEQEPSKRRFALANIVRHGRMPDIQSSLRSLQRDYENGGALGRLAATLPAATAGGLVGGPAGAVAGFFGALFIPALLVSSSHVPTQSLRDRRIAWRPQTVRQRHSAANTVQYSDVHRQLRYIDVLLYSDGQHQLKVCKVDLGYRGIGESGTKELHHRVSAIPDKALWKAWSRFYLDQEQKEGTMFTAGSSIKMSDVSRIPGPCLEPANYDGKCRRLMTSYEELLRGSLVSADNPLKELQEKGVKLPPTKEGMLPIFLPKSVMQDLECRMRSKTLLLRSMGMGSLIPRYTYRNGELGVTYYLRSPDGKKETKFCHFSGIFSIDEMARQALDGHPLQGKALSRNALDSAQLIHMLYAGYVGLKVPGQGSRRLQSGEGVAALDKSFRGGFKELDAHPSAGAQFKTAEFTGTIPTSWQQEIKLCYTVPSQAIVQEAVAKIPAFNSKATKSKTYRHYERSYYSTVMQTALIYANRRMVKGGVELVEKPDLKSWSTLFSEAGLPAAQEDFGFFEWASGDRALKPAAALERAKNYPRSQAFEVFVRQFEALTMLYIELGLNKDKCSSSSSH